MINHLIDGANLAIHRHKNRLRHYSSGSKYIPLSDESIGKWWHTNAIEAIETRLAHYEAGGEIANLP